MISWGSAENIVEPLGLEYVAAGVASDHEVRILDLQLEKGLQKVLSDFHPDVVGITACTVHVNTVKRYFQEIKVWNPQVLTVVGGHHATVMPEDFLSPHVDLIVIGEGVLSFKEIIARLEKGDSLDGIPGTAYARGDSLIKTDCPPMVDLDSLPFPDRSLTARYRKRYFYNWMKPLALLRASKGCPYRCKHCALWKLTDGRYLRRNPERLVEELSTIEEEFVYFVDEESMADATEMKTLAERIRDSEIRKRYILWVRSDSIAQNPEIVKMWRDIGLVRVFVGLESFREEDLKKVRKGSTVSDNERAVRILQELGIDMDACFMVRPDFTKADFAALRQYCRSLGLKYANIPVLTPLPGTDLYEEMESQLTTHNYDHFDVLHAVLPTTLPLNEFYEEYYKLLKTAIPRTKRIAQLKRFPLREIPSVLLRFYRIARRLKGAYLDYDRD